MATENAGRSGQSASSFARPVRYANIFVTDEVRRQWWWAWAIGSPGRLPSVAGRYDGRSTRPWPIDRDSAAVHS